MNGRAEGVKSMETKPDGKPYENGAGARAWIELNTAHLRHNIRILQNRLPKGCRLMPAVKANAYGHGAALVVRECRRMGIGDFCVATAEEGALVRQNGAKGTVLVLGYTPPERFGLLEQFCLTQTVVDYEYGWKLNGYGKPLRVQIAVDTGMHRLGERWDHIGRIRQIYFLKNLEIEGIFTHLCAADGRSRRERAFTKKQADRFWQTVNALEEEGLSCRQAHLLGSYGAISYPEFGGSFARCGIALYGVLESRSDERRLCAGLLPVLSLYAKVASVRTLEKGECAGYGLAFRARRKTRLAVLSIGYADGVPRSLSCGKGSVLICGRKVPVAGRICMDQMLVDVTKVPQAKAGDTAVLIGRDGKEEISVCDVAKQAGTISNEILSRLGTRPERRTDPGTTQIPGPALAH